MLERGLSRDEDGVLTRARNSRQRKSSPHRGRSARTTTMENPYGMRAATRQPPATRTQATTETYIHDPAKQHNIDTRWPLAAPRGQGGGGRLGAGAAARDAVRVAVLHKRAGRHAALGAVQRALLQAQRRAKHGQPGERRDDHLRGRRPGRAAPRRVEGNRGALSRAAAPGCPGPRCCRRWCTWRRRSPGSAGSG